MSITFSPLPKDQLADLLRYFKEAATKIAQRGINHWQYWHHPPQEKIDWIKDGLQKHEFYKIQDPAQQDIGIIRLQKQDHVYWDEAQNKDLALYLHSLIIFEAFNGQGLGSKVIREVEKRAKSEGCQYIRLDCDAQNKRLCHYYEKQGFKKVMKKEFPHSTNILYQKEIR